MRYVIIDIFKDYTFKAYNVARLVQNIIRVTKSRRMRIWSMYITWAR